MDNKRPARQRTLTLVIVIGALIAGLFAAPLMRAPAAQAEVGSARTALLENAADLCQVNSEPDPSPTAPAPSPTADPAPSGGPTPTHGGFLIDAVALIADEQKCKFGTEFKGQFFTVDIKINKDGKLVVKFSNGRQCQLVEVLVDGRKVLNDTVTVDVKDGVAKVKVTVRIKCGPEQFEFVSYEVTYDLDDNKATISDGEFRPVKDA